jgi:hypothetical protein
MTTVISRRIIAIPVRSSSEAWRAIVDLLASQSESDARKELLAITGISSSIISSEIMKDSPAVVYGSGPRIRFYCLYGEEAITGDSSSEKSFAFDPTEGDWKMSLPCAEEDLDWVKVTLKKYSARITVRGAAELIEDSQEVSNRTPVSIDLESFLRP